jgi:hypothetical protein
MIQKKLSLNTTIISSWFRPNENQILELSFVYFTQFNSEFYMIRKVFNEK